MRERPWFDRLARMRLVFAFCAGLSGVANLSHAQQIPPEPLSDQATLIADRVLVTGPSVLVAEGSVEVLYQGQRLRASRLTYDRTTDRLQIEGPITLIDASGNFVLADQADLAADMTQGVLTSARLILNREMQIAANRIVRSGGRYTELTNSVASSCQVCALSPTPLWEIRARRVLHDEVEHQIYFERAQLRISGVPVAYAPRLRVPDPTLDRATGFLPPSLRNTSDLGVGVKLPFFVKIGDHRDLTFTPYISSKNAQTLGLRYRQAFRTGRIEVEGALSYDNLQDGRRGYLLATGAFDLPRDFNLTFKLQSVSDRSYLLDYGLFENDRLDSRIEVARTRRNEYISGRFVHFQSIRTAESNSTLPTNIGDFTYHRRFSGGPLGGKSGLRFQAHGHDRTSDDPLDSDGNGQADGRDLQRLSTRFDWRRNWILPGGVVLSALSEATADYYDIQQDAVFGGTTTRLGGAAAVELRWPWLGAGRNGVTHVIEPVIQLAYSGRSAPNLPNDDSTLIEFDEGNLFTLNRFAGSDARERGKRVNMGLGWTRYDPSGWTIGTTLGRVFRMDDLGQFNLSSGLEGSTSDWLSATELTLAPGLKLTNRTVFDDGFDVTKAEMRLDLDREVYGLSSSYVLLRKDPAEDRLVDTSELVLNGRYLFKSNWTGKMSGRYDFDKKNATSAGVGLEFRNECMLVDLSLSRRFTSSTNVDPTTSFSLAVDLLGFGGGKKVGPAQACRH
ncbi:MAG: LPS assembly protein LptD [Paracoccaceae bacterium]|nr:LPS assembly protein LptD [Paracoccaceae bacterium]